MTCDLLSLPRKTAAGPTTVPLVLVVTASTELADVNLATGFAINVPEASKTVYASLTIQSGPAQLDVAVDPTTTIEKGQLRVVTFKVTNTGQTTANKLTASVDLPADVFLDAPEVPGDWTCAPLNGSHQTATCTLASLAPGVTSALKVAIHANGNTWDEIITASVSSDGLVAVPASTTLHMVESRLAPSAGP